MAGDGSSERTRVHLHVAGRVQGVGFRYATVGAARELGVDGWVRNLFGGEVEVVAEGSKAQLERLVEWCRRGPAGAYVRDVRAEWQEPVQGLAGFEVRQTRYPGHPGD